MQIEELTDQLMKAASLKEQSSTTQNESGAPPKPEDSAEATKPALPPGLALNSGKTTAEILADLNKSPLFMTELEDNDDIAALQALDYEGSALENTADFKERGNECFKVRGYVDAREFYTKGVVMLAAEERKRAAGEVTRSPEGVVDSDDEIAAQRAMLVSMYVNRAACNLELDNFRSVWLDCTAALRLDPRNVKAYYRAARALLKVDRVDEADDMCARGLAFDADNKALRSVAADGVYRLPNVACYVETRDGGLLKMGKKASLLKVLSTGKVEIVDQVVRIFVLPVDKADEWIVKFKEQKAKEKGRP
ncbi:hypothetical protein PWT90_10018 [Aphanocladium album]|nr:hypothetical protein PWT90_10018 [Aphanocladium album]